MSDDFSMYNALKKEFEQYKKESIKWSVEDFTDLNVDGWQISDEQAQAALEEMIYNHDANNGICWIDVEYYLKDYGIEVSVGTESWRINQ
jgi:hypothetical protein